MRKALIPKMYRDRLADLEATGVTLSGGGHHVAAQG